MRKRIYFGLFLVTMTTLMFEIILTRIFSVTMWYHFAFVAISVVMFGMTVGALIVYLNPEFFILQKVKRQLALSALLFSITAVASLIIQLSFHFTTQGIFSLSSTYILVSIPFIFSGICVCLALTKFPEHISKLYAADLAGAALGCVFIIILLKITDAPTVVICIAFLSALASYLFASIDAGKGKLSKIALMFCLAFLLFSVFNTFLLNHRSQLIRITWAKGHAISKPLYEKWNQISWVSVWGNPKRLESPFMWGPSPIYQPTHKIRQLNITIDAGAGTPMTNFNGDLSKLVYLKYDITNLVHYLKRDANVLVIGSGGGRDILSALVFNQKSVVGVEINKDITNSVNVKFGRFTGHLDRNPKVRFINDEARSYIARSNKKYDIIEISLIDTWASTAAGGYVLAENSLYTTEGWRIFLDHLTPMGVLTVSRCYVNRDLREAYRLTSLACASLKNIGISNPRKYIFMAKSRAFVTDKTNGIVTMLISKQPFSVKDLDSLQATANLLKFDVVLSPRYSINKNFDMLASAGDIRDFLSKFDINLTAPSDDSPFFFQMFRFKNIFNTNIRSFYQSNKSMQAVFMLGDLLVLVIVLTLICIIIPLLIKIKSKNMTGCFSYSIYFISIGIGFMLIEISQLQRLIIFLGHPVYSLSVVLFSFLLFSSLGSIFTQRLWNDPIKKMMPIVFLLMLLGMLLTFGMQTNFILHHFDSCATWRRILISVTMLFPLGFYMGMPFVFGMKSIPEGQNLLSSWLWGINGAASVCASVLAVAISMFLGISFTYWTGAFFYLLAFLSYFSFRTKSFR